MPNGAAAPPDAAGTEAKASALPRPEVLPTAAPTPRQVSHQPPTNFEPPFKRSAAKADGHWSPWGELQPGQASGLFRSVVHPGKFSRFLSMSIVAIDLSRFALNWAIGKGEEGAEKMARLMPPGLVPESQQKQTVAIFNGGFLARHGRWGIRSQGVEIQPQKPSGCTIMITEQGDVVLGTWKTIKQETPAIAEAATTLRQTPPCLVESGTLHPHLAAGNARRWAGSNPTRKTRRRSALGLSADGKTLYYAVGVETGPLELARGMLAAGAHTALQLDINWSWTRFLLAGPNLDDGGYHVTEPLRSDMEFTSREYFSRPSIRDFFYVTRAKNL